MVAVSVDRPEVTLQHCRELGFTYTFLSDHQREAIRRYKLVHAGGGPTGDIARPAEFLIDSHGVVRWRFFTSDYYVRLRPEQVFAALDRM